jgi:putative nucleotidyltransferase with HDIG domain
LLVENRRFRLIRWQLVSLYAAVLALAAIGLGVVLWVEGFRFTSHGPAWLLILFALIAVLAEQKSITLSRSSSDEHAGLEISVAFLPLLFVAVAFGPLAAAVVGGFTMVGVFGQPYTRWIVWTANRSLISGMAGLAAHAALHLDISAPARIVTATAAAAFVDFALDVLLASLVLLVRGSGSPREMVKATAPVAAAAVPLYTPVVGLLAYAYLEVTTWSAVMFFVPAFAAQQLFVLYRDQRDALRELAAANSRLEEANVSFATALVATLDARDRYTAGHSAAVAVYARDIAERMGLSVEDQQQVHLAGLVHDIGKVGLPPGLLEKAGPLSLEERRAMEQHATIGERILANVADYSEIAAVVRHHHERVDGRGYPDGRVGDGIPLLSRIIAVADAYNAMTSDRPYRDAMPSRVARLRLAQAVETQFDTSVVAAFEAILAGSTEGYRSGTAEQFRMTRHDAYGQTIATVIAA